MGIFKTSMVAEGAMNLRGAGSQMAYLGDKFT